MTVNDPFPSIMARAAAARIADYLGGCGPADLRRIAREIDAAYAPLLTACQLASAGWDKGGMVAKALSDAIPPATPEVAR